MSDWCHAHHAEASELREGFYLFTARSWHHHHFIIDRYRKLWLFMKIYFHPCLEKMVRPRMSPIEPDSGSWKNGGKVTSPPGGSSNTYFSLFNFHFRNNFETYDMFTFLLNSNNQWKRDSLRLGHSRHASLTGRASSWSFKHHESMATTRRPHQGSGSSFLVSYFPGWCSI